MPERMLMKVNQSLLRSNELSGRAGSEKVVLVLAGRASNVRTNIIVYKVFMNIIPHVMKSIES
jgi:hypothetical protein